MNGAMAPGRADRVSAGLARGPPDHRHFGAPDRRHGRRRLGVRAGGGRGPPEERNSPARPADPQRIARSIRHVRSSFIAACRCCCALSPRPPSARRTSANPAALSEQAPATYKARSTPARASSCSRCSRDWAPNGADRFYNLVKNGFYDNARFFRVISGFMVQFGINGDPELSAQWREARIQDDPVTQSNKRGYHHLRHGRPEHAHQPGVHQLRRQRRRSTARASRRSARWSPA